MRIVRYNSVTGERTEYDDGNPPPPLTCLCPCCGHLTLAKRGDYEICPVCFWEDDGQDDPHSDEVLGGPNGELSLTQARSNYKAFGACEESMLANVRPPTAHEVRG